MSTGEFGYEIDFLPVGNGERSGDAIAVRYGSMATGYVVMVVDGGTNESGEALVELVQRHYRTDHVDFVVNTHPDADHASGLTVVLNSLSVGQLWMHQPWLHSLEMLHMFRSRRLTSSGLARRTREALGAAWELAKLAERNNVPVYEPLQGAQLGNFHVLSPERLWYRALVSQFRNTPRPQARVTSALGLSLGTVGVAARVDSAAMQWVAESMNVETLEHDAATSAENESSAVLYGELGHRRVLLTGDAGVHALSCAADYAEGYGVHLCNLDLM